MTEKQVFSMPPTLPTPRRSEMLLSRRKKPERSEEIDMSELHRQNLDLIAENQLMKRYLNSLLMPREYHWVIEDFTWSTRLYVSEVFCFAGKHPPFSFYILAFSHSFCKHVRPLLDMFVWIQ